MIQIWLAKLSTEIANISVLLELWNEVKVIAIAKTGKPANNARNYRPISLQTKVI